MVEQSATIVVGWSVTQLASMTLHLCDKADWGRCCVGLVLCRRHHDEKGCDEVNLIEAGYAADLYEHPDDPDEKMLLIATDRFLCPGWPAKRPIRDLGRVRTAISSVIYEHLLGRFAIAYLGPGTQMPGRTMEMRWYEPAPVSIVVIGSRSGVQRLDARDRSMVERFDQTLKEGSDELATPVVWPTRSQQLPIESGLLDDQTTASLVKASLVQRMKLSALLLYGDLKAWYDSHGFTLGAIRFDFGVTEEDLLVAGQVGLLDFVEANLSGASDDEPIGRAAFRQLTGTMTRSGGPAKAEVIDQLVAQHIEVYERLSGQRFSNWDGQPSSYDGQRTSRGILRRRW